MNAPKVLGIGGALLLVATAALHLSGYGEVAGQLQSAGLPDFWREALKATWVFFSVQLVIIAAAVAAQFTKRAAANRAVLVVCTAMLAGTVLVLVAWLGLFIGTLAVAVATIAIGAATALLVRRA
jgi:CHASE2 domain-containing sensor protein